MDQKKLIREFESREHTYKGLIAESLFILEASLQKGNVKIHSISHRLKTLQSFLEKTERQQVNDPLEEIHDIVGLRVVCLFLSDIEIIGKLIRSNFLVRSEDNKIEGADVSSFGYMSVHFIVEMKKEHKGPRYDSIAGIAFEIQVRTIAMDAWANVSHHLDYKSDKDVPSNLRKDFYALSGLFYVADRHFEMFYNVSKDSQQSMVELFEADDLEAKDEQEINLDSLTAYLNKKLPARKLPKPLAISELVNELLKAGYKSIGDVDRMLESSSDAFDAYEKQHPPAAKSRNYSVVGQVRISAKIFDDRFIQATVPASQRTRIQRYKKYRNLLK